MRFILLSYCLLILGSFETVKHHANLAIFDFIEAEGQIKMTIRLDEEHLEQSIGYKLNNASMNETVRNYILANLNLEVNQQHKQLCVNHIYQEDRFTNVEGTIDAICEPISIIAVSNTCLVDIEDHSNIMKFNVNDSRRVFRLTAKRTSTIVRY